MKPSEFKCDGCPAIGLKSDKGQFLKIKQWEKMREKAIDEIAQIKLYLLCESIPADRFFYDLDRDYENRGLRFNIKEELELDSDQDVLWYFRKWGIVLADCALCPLFQLESNAAKKHAASLCLRNNTIHILNINPEAPIITIFPTHRGYLKNEFPEVDKRKVEEFSFNDLSGLKVSIERFTR